VSAERALLRRIEGGCQAPMGALAQLRDDVLHLRSGVCSLDGRTSIDLDDQATLTGELPARIAQAAALGERLAQRLLERGAGDILARQRELQAQQQLQQVKS
jgi:hydroxymethylbilane synthase